MAARKRNKLLRAETTLPTEEHARALEETARRKGCMNVAEYLRHLIRQDAEREDEKRRQGA